MKQAKVFLFTIPLSILAFIVLTTAVKYFTNKGTGLIAGLIAYYGTLNLGYNSFRDITEETNK